MRRNGSHPDAHCPLLALASFQPSLRIVQGLLGTREVAIGVDDLVVERVDATGGSGDQLVRLRELRRRLPNGSFHAVRLLEIARELVARFREPLRCFLGGGAEILGKTSAGQTIA